MFWFKAIIIWAAVGAVVGIFIQRLHLGRHTPGRVSLIMLGIAGALAGGIFASCVHCDDVLCSSALLTSVLGAATLLVVSCVEAPDLHARYHNAYRITRH